MADIFISYARTDRAVVEKLAAALEREGFSVWWDRQIESGAEFSRDIEKALHAAPAVIVAWSAASCESAWVRDEAMFARDKGKLIPIRLDATEPPLGFRQFQAADFSAWSGGPAPLLSELATSVRRRLGAQGPTPEERPAPARTPGVLPDRFMHIRKRYVFAALAGVLLIAGAVFFAGRMGAGPSAEGARATQAAAAQDNSIAVLPFADMSAEKDQEYFADGISEELLNVLAQVRGLQVAGRTSSFAFKGENRDLREIGKLLNVAHILEGSVRKAGDRVRITAQLVKAEDGYHLWSGTYDRQLTDIFAVQDEIADAILKEMAPHLPGVAQVEKISPTARADIAAYDLYLLAREKMTQEGSREDYEQAARLLDDAIAQDPDYAPALAWRAYAASMLSDSYGGVGDTPVKEALPVIKRYADRALAADANSPEAMFAVGSYYGQLGDLEPKENLPKAIEWLRKAVAARPNFSQAQNDLAFFLAKIGQEAEAFALIEDVLRYDPGLRDANTLYVDDLSEFGRFDEAIEALERWSTLKPDLLDPKAVRAAVDLRRGRLADAWRTFNKANVPQWRTLGGNIRTALHDGEWLEANEDESWRSVAAILNGDPAKGARLASESEFARRNAANGLLVYVNASSASGRYADIVVFYETSISNPEAAIATATACGCRLAPLAHALKVSRHNHYDELMMTWKRKADRDRTLYANGPTFISNEGDRLALSGDAGEAANLYARAIELGWRDSFFIHDEYRPWLPQTDEIDALQTKMRALIDEERAKLGMPPI